MSRDPSLKIYIRLNSSALWTWYDKLTTQRTKTANAKTSPHLPPANPTACSQKQRHLNCGLTGYCCQTVYKFKNIYSSTKPEKILKDALCRSGKMCFDWFSFLCLNTKLTNYLFSWLNTQTDFKGHHNFMLFYCANMWWTPPPFKLQTVFSENSWMHILTFLNVKKRIW